MSVFNFKLTHYPEGPWLGGSAPVWQQRAGRLRRSVSLKQHLLAVTSVLLALQGCANKPVVQADTEDLSGMATTCDGPTIEPAPASASTAAIVMSNDGWCAARAAEKDGQPFQLGLVSSRPEHGRVLIHKVFGKTRIEYTPDAQYAGADRFVVALRPREAGAADASVTVSVSVSAPQEGKRPAPASS